MTKAMCAANSSFSVVARKWQVCRLARSFVRVSDSSCIIFRYPYRCHHTSVRGTLLLPSPPPHIITTSACNAAPHSAAIAAHFHVVVSNW